jgi:uncharacterized protein
MYIEILVTSLVFLVPAATTMPFLRTKDEGKAAPKKERNSTILRIKAGAGNAEAQYLLGIQCVERGDGDGSLRWLTKSAESGYGEAQSALGFLFEQGKIVATDMTVAFEWYSKAAAQHNAQAATRLGNLFFYGHGVERNYSEARKWLDTAANRGDLQARNDLSWFLSTCPDEDFRNGRRAVNLLAHVVSLGNKDPVVVDTLAAAYAEAGMMDEAVRFANLALEAVDRTVDPSLHEQVEKHRDRYVAGWPWRETVEEILPEAAGETPDEAAHDEPGVDISLSGELAPVSPSFDEPPAARESAIVDSPASDDLSLSEQFDFEFDEEGEASGEAVSVDDTGVEEYVIVDETPLDDALIAEGILSSLQDGTAPATNETAPPEQPVSSYLRAEEISAGSPAQMERIVEKLVQIEELLRPLKTDETIHDTRPCGPDEPGSSAPHVPSDDPGRPLHQEALQFSKAFVDAILDHRYTDAYSRMDAGFQEAVSEDQMGPMILEMYASYGGEPKTAELTSDESVYNVDQERRVHKFWYDLSGDGYGKGEFTFSTEIASSAAGLVCTSFFISPTDRSSPQSPEEAHGKWYP